MNFKISKETRKALNFIAAIAVIALLVFIIWLDIAVGWWAETVILSGIAAGILTFFLTALFIERWMANREHERWFPVTRLALTDILHTMSDDEHSDIHRGHIVPRSLTVPDVVTHQHLHELLDRVISERNELTEALARWAQFLASSADVQDLMNHIADLAENLDYIRDTIVELEKETPGTPGWDESELEVALTNYNAANVNIIEEIQKIQGSMATTSTRQ